MLPSDRLAYSPITQREPLSLPGGAPMVVWTIVNVEAWDATQPMPRTVITPPSIWGCFSHPSSCPAASGVLTSNRPTVKLEGISALAADKQGNIYVIHRPTDPNGDPIVVLDAKDNLLRSWGKGMYKNPHGIR